MARLTIPFVGSRHVDRAVQVNSQRAVNWMPSIEGEGAKSILTLHPTPGLDLRLSTGNGPTRSNFVVFQGELYWVSGGQLLSIDSSETVTVIGALNTTSGRCYLAAGRDYIVCVDGGDLYAWDGSAFSVVTDSGDGNYDADCPTNPIYIGFIDGYFIVLAANSDSWQISAQEDPTDWNAADIASAEANSDDAVAVVTTYRDIYIIGEVTTQVYYNSGNADFPFELYANGVLEFGTPAPASVARSGGNIFMLAQVEGGSTTVLRVNGFQAQRIADPDIAYTIGRMTTVSDAEGYAYIEDDQTYYVLTFPTEDLTLVYHVEANMWHDRQSKGMGRHRSCGHGRFNGRHYVGDFDNNKVYALNPTKYTDDGQTIRRVRAMGVMHRDGRQFEVNSFEVEFKRGVGLESGQGSDPQAILRYSRDGGNTWSNELWRAIGKQGDYTARSVWNRLGQMADLRAELVVTDPVEAIVVSAYADVEILSA